MQEVSLGKFVGRVTACHVATYFVVGALAFAAFDYATLFSTDPWSSFMRPTDSVWVAAGPAFQVLRGLVFALALYPFRAVFVGTTGGWLKLWGLLVGLAILSTTGPAPGSIEGLVYTRLPADTQVLALRETVTQTWVFSVLLVRWHERGTRVWSVTMYGLAALAILASAAAVAERTGVLGGS